MFSKFFVQRPKFAIVISILMMLAGVICAMKLPISEYPEVAPPTIRVQAKYPGASSQELTEVIAPMIEQQMIGIEKLEYFSSSSSNEGVYSLNLVFQAGADSDIAMVNVSNAIKRIEAKLPSEVTQNGVEVKARTGDMLCFINFLVDETKTDLSPLDLANYVKMNVKDVVCQIDGISACDIIPSKEYAMRIWLNIHKMSAMGITPGDIQTALREQNVQAAAGSIGSGDETSMATYKITVDGRLKTTSEFENIIIKRGKEGRITKLKDIARVELAAENMTGYNRLNGEDTVGLMVSRSNDANALDAIKNVKKKLKELEKRFPEGVSWTVGYDPTQAIDATMKEIIITLVIALAMVVLITYIFLQDWRAAIIPSVAIPVSLLGALVFIYALGFSINVLTMFGLILVIGSLVDDAIVVVENVSRIIHEEGLSPRQATIKGMRQITGAVIATTLVTIAVYVPIAFYGGMVGTIYMQFSVTMCIALIISTFNALTLSPALCALLLKPRDAEKISKAREYAFLPFNWSLEFSRKIYLWGAGILVRRSILTILILGVALYLNYDLFKGTKSSFIPTEDKGTIFVMVEMSSDATSKLRTNEAMLDIEKRISKIPGVDMISTSVGYNFMSGAGENKGMCIVRLDHWDKRTTPELSAESIQKKIQAAVAEVPAAKTQVNIPPAIMGLGMTGGVSAVLKISGDKATPQLLGEGVMDMCDIIGERVDIVLSKPSSTFSADAPLVHLNINREKAQSMNIPLGRIFSTVSSKLASSYVNDFTLNGFNFKVMIQANPHQRQTPQQILSLNVQNDNGQMVPLSSFCSISYERGAQIINRFEQVMSADIIARTKEGVGSGELMTLFEETAAKMNEEPKWKDAGIVWEVAWKDLSYQERKNQGQIVYLFGLSLLFAFLFLVAQYESWTTPIPVMLSVCVATLGAFIGIKIMGLTMSIYVQLGLLMLIGLASKNAILIVEFSKKEHEHGTPIEQAAMDGASKRYRAVLMTAISFIFGVFPLVIAQGSGAMSRQEIGITTFYGMLLATVGIFLIPGLYALFAKIRYRLIQRKPLAKEETH